MVKRRRSRTYSVQSNDLKEQECIRKTMPVPDWPTTAKIYKIWWRDSEDCYVGHTRHSLLSQRMSGHRANAKRGKLSPVYAAIRNNDPFEYDLLETVFCENFDRARTHERRWAENLGANLNGHRPIITKEENKERRNAWNKEWRAKPENKAKLKSKRKTYSAKYLAKPKTKAKRKEYMKVLRAKPEYKEKCKVADKAWFAKNRREKRYACEACQYYAPRKHDLTRHQKSKRHLNRQTQI